MKFFVEKAFTLVELIVSVTILGIVFGTILFFMSASVESIAESQKDVKTAQTVFDLKKDLDLEFNKGLNAFKIIDASNGYDAVLFYDKQQTEGVLFGVIDNQTKKLKQAFTYGENFLGIRRISEKELQLVLTDNSLVFNKEFLAGKIYNLSIIKDFSAEVYTGDRLTEPIIDITFSVFTYENDDDFGKDFSALQIPDKFLYFYNFVF